VARRRTVALSPFQELDIVTNSRTAIFIDGPNLYATAKSLGFEIDYKKLLTTYRRHGCLVRAFYYAPAFEDAEHRFLRPLLDWLDCIEYTVVTTPEKHDVDAGGRRTMKAKREIELAVNAMDFAERMDEMVLFSGNGDLRALVRAVQRRGVRVTVVSTIKRHASTVADELRRQADVFQDLDELRGLIGCERPAQRDLAKQTADPIRP
jgi:uncharacterized LabA/DUF88 family protein